MDDFVFLHNQNHLAVVRVAFVQQLDPPDRCAFARITQRPLIRPFCRQTSIGSTAAKYRRSRWPTPRLKHGNPVPLSHCHPGNSCRKKVPPSPVLSWLAPIQRIGSGATPFPLDNMHISATGPHTPLLTNCLLVGFMALVRQPPWQIASCRPHRPR